MVRRTFKVKSRGKSQAFGLSVADASVASVLKAACSKLKISEIGATLRTLDNTIIDNDDYLLSDDLKSPNNNIVVVPRGDDDSTTADLLNNLSVIVHKLEGHYQNNPKEVHRQMDKRRDLSAHNNIVVGGIQQALASTAHHTHRHHDPKWFEGVKPRFKTKEKFMRDRARSRIVGYLSVAKTYVKECKVEATKKVLESAIEKFIDKLREVDYNEGYFDRTNSTSRLCDDKGNFFCAGAYDKDCCTHKGVINPYSAARYRIKFSSWNLDHVIEKSRSILPSLLTASEKVAGSNGKLEVNVDYFFGLLFTTENLKLVEPECHDKTEHSDRQCDDDKTVRKSRR